MIEIIGAWMLLLVIPAAILEFASRRSERVEKAVEALVRRVFGP